MAEHTATATKAKSDSTAKMDENAAGASTEEAADAYVLPVVHVRVPSMIVDVGFWGCLAGAVALGVVDPPLGVLVGAGVVIAHHGRKG